MSAIQEHQKLKIIFQLNRFLGFSLAYRHKKKILQFVAGWDVITLVITFLSFYFTIATLYRILDNVKISSYSQPLVISIIYCNILIKTVNLSLKKQQIFEMFNIMNDIVAFKPFCKFQKPTVDLICTKIRNTVFILSAISLSCVCGMLTVMASNMVKLQIKISMNDTYLTKEEEITQEISHANKLTKSDLIVMFINSIVNLILPIKNIGMDSLMLFCHYFVVQQLKLLARQFKNTKNYKHSMEKHFNSHGQNLRIWMEMFNKVKK
jgi:hypothetical protein